MGYSTSTVGSLMTLVDEHRDEIKESTYVEICNALKFLHDNKKRQEELRRQNLTVRPSVPSASPQVRPSVPPPPTTSQVSRPNQYTQEQVNRYRDRVNSFYRLISNNTSPGRISNADKRDVLIGFGYSGGLTNVELKVFVEQLVSEGRLTMPRFKVLCTEKKMQRHQVQQRQLSEQYRMMVRNLQRMVESI